MTQSAINIRVKFIIDDNVGNICISNGFLDNFIFQIDFLTDLMTSSRGKELILRWKYWGLER